MQQGFVRFVGVGLCEASRVQLLVCSTCSIIHTVRGCLSIAPSKILFLGNIALHCQYHLLRKIDVSITDPLLMEVFKDNNSSIIQTFMRHQAILCLEKLFVEWNDSLTICHHSLDSQIAHLLNVIISSG